MDKLSFGKLVQYLRRQNDWTVKEFIDKLNSVGASTLSPSYISKIEVYGEIPSPKLICQIAEVFKYSEEDLFAKAKKQKLGTFQESLERKFEDERTLYRREREDAK